MARNEYVKQLKRYLDNEPGVVDEVMGMDGQKGWMKRGKWDKYKRDWEAYKQEKQKEYAALQVKDRESLKVYLERNEAFEAKLIKESYAEFKMNSMSGKKKEQVERLKEVMGKDNAQNIALMDKEALMKAINRMSLEGIMSMIQSGDPTLLANGVSLGLSYTQPKPLSVVATIGANDLGMFEKFNKTLKVIGEDAIVEEEEQCVTNIGGLE